MFIIKYLTVNKEKKIMLMTAIGVFIGATFIYAGIKQIVTGRMDGASKDYEKYTAESMKKASIVTGFLYFPISVLFVLQDLVWDGIIVSPIKPDFIYIIAVGALLLLVIISYNILVKKNTVYIQTNDMNNI